MNHLNSFQKWATDYAVAFGGWTVTPCGNWVTLERRGERHEIMTMQGIQAICDKDRWPSELTPAGEQTVIPGCERQPVAGKPAQLSLFGG